MSSVPSIGGYSCDLCAIWILVLGVYVPRSNGSLTLLFVLVSRFRRFYVTISHNSTFRVCSESYFVGQLKLFHLLSV